MKRQRRGEKDETERSKGVDAGGSRRFLRGSEGGHHKWKQKEQRDEK